MNDLIKKEDGSVILAEDSIRTIYEVENQIQALKKVQDQYKKILLEEMEKANCIKLDTDKFSISYVGETTRETFDTKEFQKKHKVLYDKYVKMTPVKSSLRIKLKE